MAWRGGSKQGFNPTLVRLRPFLGDPLHFGHDGFQSHAGSIEAHRGLDSGRSQQGCFNPTLVRLRPLVLTTDSVIQVPSFNPTLVRLRPPERCGCRPTTRQVSIPRWFD